MYFHLQFKLFKYFNSSDYHRFKLIFNNIFIKVDSGFVYNDRMSFI